MKWNGTTKIIGILIALILVLGLGYTFFNSNDDADTNSDDTSVTDFTSCEEAGGDILESFPEQCSLNGETYTRVLDELVDLESEEAATETEDLSLSDTEEEDITLSLFFTSDDLIARDCGGTVETTRTIPYTTGVARAALLELFNGPLDSGAEAGYTGSFEGWNEAFNSIDLSDDGTLTIDFNDSVVSAPFNLSNYGTSCGTGAWQQIYQTMNQFPTVNYVVFSINGSNSDFAGYAFPRGCPVVQADGESDQSFTQAQKQCL